MSISIGAIIGSVGSGLSGLANGALTAIKIIASIAFGLIFAAAIVSLLNFVQELVFGSIIGEFFALLSVNLPFNPATVFYSVLLIVDGIVAFLVARKVYQLVSNLIGVSG